MKLNFPLRLLAAASLAAASFLAQAADLTVAYQTTVDPAKVAQADGAYEKSHQSRHRLAQVRQRRRHHRCHRLR